VEEQIKHEGGEAKIYPGPKQTPTRTKIALEAMKMIIQTVRGTDPKGGVILVNPAQAAASAVNYADALIEKLAEGK
jgi:hypothetical protein